MSKYEDSPTSSQKMKIWMKLFDSTIPSMEKVNNDMQAK